MQISLGAIWGMISLFSWGVGDYLARIYSTKVGSLRTAFYIRFISLFPSLLIFPVQAYLGQLYNPTDWTVVLQLGPILGIVLALAAVAYYRGLETGVVSIVVAVTSAWFAVGVILAFILLGEVLSIQQALIIGIIAMGIIMLSGLQTSTKDKSTGFLLGLTSMFLLGTATLLFKYLGEASGSIMTSFVGSLGSIIMLWVWLRISGLEVVLPKREGIQVLIAAGLLEAGGVLSMIIGLSQAPIFIVAPLSAAHPIVTMSLALIFLKERLSRVQSVGVMLTVLGVIALSANG